MVATFGRLSSLRGTQPCSRGGEYGLYPTSFVHGIWGLRGQDGPFHIRVDGPILIPLRPRTGVGFSHLIALIAVLEVVLLALVESASGLPVRNRRVIDPVS